MHGLRRTHRQGWILVLGSLAFHRYYRRPHDPHNRKEYHHFGFRCAKDASSELDFPICAVQSFFANLAAHSGNAGVVGRCAKGKAMIGVIF
jgi:hypothetical protein